MVTTQKTSTQGRLMIHRKVDSEENIDQIHLIHCIEVISKIQSSTVIVEDIRKLK